MYLKGVEIPGLEQEKAQPTSHLKKTHLYSLIRKCPIKKSPSDGDKDVVKF